jgi:hypothetical protein
MAGMPVMMLAAATPAISIARLAWPWPSLVAAARADGASLTNA